MTIREIYREYLVPPNLEEHMLRVAAVVNFIHWHWRGEMVDWDGLLKISLIHDLGNVVKFKESDFQDLRQKMIDKYGSDDHIANRKILDELGVDERFKNTVASKSFGNSVTNANSDDWFPKILHYSDMRVMPNGICTLDERMEDIRIRYSKYANRPDFGDLIGACHKIEDQIQENVAVRLSEISNETVKVDDQWLNIVI